MPSTRTSKTLGGLLIVSVASVTSVITSLVTAPNVAIQAVGIVQSSTGLFGGTGATVGFYNVPEGASTGTASTLVMRSVNCNATGALALSNPNGVYRYNHCNIAYPTDVDSGSGVVIMRIEYDQGNAPSAAKIDIRMSTGATYSGSFLHANVENLTAGTGKTVVWGTGSFIWMEGKVLRAVSYSTASTAPFTSHQARMTVWFHDRREGQQ